MTLFYEKALQDPVLSPYFVLELGDDLTDDEWIHHIELLADFWLAKLLGENTYGGNFVGAHVNVPYINRESFVRWLELFSTTLDEVYISDVAKKFKTLGENMSEQFMGEINI
ncbi:MAG: group III truncated hemoglobin [Campylobacterota bacterium]|nr:group III truncated hemoglobin [Campylobacterota bacterium]